MRALAEGLGELESKRTRVLCFRAECKAFKDLGAKPWPIPSGRFFRPWQLPPVTLTHGPNFYALPRPRAKTVITVHDLGFHHFPEDYPPEVVTSLSGCLSTQEEKVDLVICISVATETDLLDAYPGYAGRTTVIPHGVDSTWFTQPEPRETREILRRSGIDRPYVLHLGALVPRKNLETVVRAWIQARGDYPDVGLVLAGPDATGWKSDLATIRSLVSARAEWSTGLHIIGYVDDRIARALMAAARAYICASKNEGFGLPILEAMAAGIPVIATSIPAIEEVAAGTVDYVPVGDVDATADAIRRVVGSLDHPKIQAARTRASSFTWARCAEKTLASYTSLIAQ